jgi:hypothetical protein
MEQTDLLYIESMKAWNKTQELVIKSCDLNIKQFKEQIEFINQQIECEEKEKAAKILLRNHSIDNYHIWLKEKEDIEWENRKANI